jgi:predicted DNA-binding protein (MmcQ/YjbR family)
MTGPMSDFRDTVRAICAPLPGTEATDVYGPDYDAWKVGGKNFATAGAGAHGVSVKTPDAETAALLVDTGIGRKAAYYHASWVNLPEETAPDELRHRIVTAYDLIRAKLTKKVQAALPPREVR